MKKIKIIPVLALTALLSACEIGGLSVKAPKFAKEGDKVEASKFIEDALKVMNDLDVYKEGATFQDKIIKGKISQGEETFTKRDGKKINLSSTKSVSSFSFEFDYDSKVALGKSNIKNESSQNSYTMTSSATGKQAQDIYLQKFSHDGKNYFGMVDKKEKEVQSYYELSELITEKYMFEMLLTMTEVQYLGLSDNKELLETQYSAMPADEQAKFSFYENGNVYTVIYKSETESNSADYDGKVTIEYKIQYEVKGNDVVYRAAQEVLEVRDYKKNVSGYPNDHLEGDHYEDKAVRYYDTSAKDKSVSLTAVDTTGYHFSSAS